MKGNPAKKRSQYNVFSNDCIKKIREEHTSQMIEF